MRPVCLASASLFLALAASAAAEECPLRGTVSATVAVAIDGATLSLTDGREIRLAGVEAPPRPLALAASASWPSEELSRAGLERLVSGGSLSLSPASANPDRYGRTHVYAFLPDGGSLQAALAAEGLVRVRWFPNENGCFGSFLAAEAGARQARRGLWGDAEYAIRTADDPSLPARNGLYDLVEGRVVSVGHGSRMIFLDFGRNYRQDFTVMVPPLVADALVAAGRPADRFAKRRVRVRGVIEESGGAAMRLNDPAEIEFMDDELDDAAAPR
jgi:endonuclease YncB( thermonuclease family)